MKYVNMIYMGYDYFICPNPIWILSTKEAPGKSMTYHYSSFLAWAKYIFIFFDIEYQLQPTGHAWKYSFSQHNVYIHRNMQY